MGGCNQVKPPKDRLIKDFTLNWRPNSDIVYVYETTPSGRYGPILGMYEKQTVTHNKKFLYRQARKFLSPKFGPAGARAPTLDIVSISFLYII